MSDDQKKNYQTMKDIAPYTRLSPDERLQDMEILISKVNGPELQIIKPRTVTGYQLNNPEVRLASNSVVRAKDGSLNVRDSVKLAIHFKDWVVVYSRGKNSKYDDEDADKLAALIL
jgi:hypothetical protein